MDPGEVSELVDAAGLAIPNQVEEDPSPGWVLKRSDEPLDVLQARTIRRPFGFLRIPWPGVHVLNLAFIAP
jgi:hypothetical protein